MFWDENVADAKDDLRFLQGSKYADANTRDCAGSMLKEMEHEEEIKWAVDLGIPVNGISGRLCTPTLDRVRSIYFTSSFGDAEALHQKEVELLCFLQKTADSTTIAPDIIEKTRELLEATRKERTTVLAQQFGFVPAEETHVSSVVFGFLFLTLAIFIASVSK